MNHVPNPGLANQAGVRLFFRIVGPLVLLAALGLVVVGGIDFFSTVDSFEGPQKFWMMLVGIPLLAVGGWLCQVGYAGVAARYASGELSPVLKDSATYLTDGEGLFGVGRTVDARGEAGTMRAAAAGSFCRSCGVRNDGDARYCDGCGRPLA